MSKDDKKLTQSLENYLLGLDDLIDKGVKIKVKDLAQYMKLGAPSTADAVKKLKEKGFINYVPYSDITLTAKGIEAVTMKKYRHNTIAKFLHNVLDIDVKKAEENADAIEYSMTQDVLTRLVNFMDFMEQCACPEPKWMNSCKNSLETGKISKKCQGCASAKGKNGCGCCNCNREEEH